MNLDLPPLHPALVHFPIALVTLSFVFDLLGRLLHRRSFQSAGWWTLCAGAITGVLTIPLGYFDMNRAALDESTHELVDMHLKIGWTVLVVVAGLTIWRFMIRRIPDRGPGGGYLAVAFLVMALTLFQGWYGGEMVYSHGAGVAAAEQGTQTAERSQRSLKKVNAALSKIPGFASGPSHHHEEINESAGAKQNEEEHK